MRRHDYVVNLVQTAIETLLFYHPAVWWLSRRIRHERECCCDDLAVAACGNRLSYARALATLEELRPPARQLVLAADGGRLLTRICRILGQPAPRYNRSRHWLLGLTLSATLLTIGVAIGLANFATGDEPTKKPDEPPPAFSSAQPTKPVEQAQQHAAGARAIADENANADGIDMAVQKSPSNPKDGMELPEELGDRIGKFPHVTNVTGFLSDGPRPGGVGGPGETKTPMVTESVPAVEIYGLPPNSSRVQQLKLIEGRRLTVDDHRAVMVGKSLNWKVGERSSLYGKGIEVIGIVDKEPVWDRSVIMSLSEMQDWADRPHKVTGFLIHVDIPRDGSPEHVAQLRALRKQIAGLGEDVVSYSWASNSIPPARGRELDKPDSVSEKTKSVKEAEKPNPPPEAKPAEPAKPVEKATPQGRGRSGFIMSVMKKPNINTKSADFLPEEVGERIKKLPHVKTVSGWLMDYTPIDPLVNASVMLMGWPPDSIVLDNWKFVSGRFPRADEHRKIVVGKEIAAKLSLKAGDTLGLFGNAVEVLGVFESAYPAENDGIYMLLSDLQEITKRPHQVTSFAVSVDIPQDGSPEHEVQAAELRKYIEALGDGIVAFVAPDPPAPAAQITAKQSRRGSAETERAVVAAIKWLSHHLNPDPCVDFIVQKVRGSAELNNDLPEGLGDRIRKLSRVKSVSGGLMDAVSFEERNLPAVIIEGLQADSPLFEQLTILSGRKLDAGDHHKVIVGKVLAANLDKKVGDIIRIYDTPLEIIGVFESKNAFENGAIFTLLADMQDFMNRQHSVTGFFVRTDIPNDNETEHKAQLDEVRKAIEALDNEIAVVPANQASATESSDKPAKKAAEGKVPAEVTITVDPALAAELRRWMGCGPG